MVTLANPQETVEECVTVVTYVIGPYAQQIVLQHVCRQQIHAQQLPHGAHGPGMPMGPHPGLPGMGPAAGLLGFGAGLAAGVPGAPGNAHPAVAAAAHPLLKPADMHARDHQDLKRPGSTNAEERLYYHLVKTEWSFVINALFVTFVLIHWLTCMQFIIPVMTGEYFSGSNEPNTESWIYTNGIQDKSWLLKYSHCFFKASSEMFGIRLHFYKLEIASDYMVSILTYIIGKVIIFTVWIILVVAILNSKSMKIRFLEVINQVDEYMSQKKLPINLRERIRKYYDFRYQKRFFREDVITNLLSANLKREVHVNMCKSLISKVPIFNNLPPDQISGLVSKLTPETFLPKDVITRSGMYTESMYFISTGTVAVYSHSGKEVCHLQDGAYFGEISLVTKNHLVITTVIAIETSHLYKLRKTDFEHCLKNNKEVFQRVLAEAEYKLKKLLKIEEDYKKMVFAKTYKTEADTLSQ
ncbi:hypothetical protein JTB14_021661 [Gonioctena quinquepunctata]|nr:hypothetical protein JTB14_021661 [Gonioctena quinquepunctata]